MNKTINTYHQMTMSTVVGVLTNF